MGFLCLYFLQETVENGENEGREALIEEDANSTNGDAVINNNEDEEESDEKNSPT